MTGQARQREVETSIDNAGPVLLWRFPRTLFERTGLLQDDRFRDDDAADRAVHLLQDLVGDAGTSEETALALNKVLCGLDLAYPVRRSIEATETEREVALDLLDHVPRAWERTSGTSARHAAVKAAMRKEEAIRREDLLVGIQREYAKEGRVD